jgi:hypothetical protein
MQKANVATVTALLRCGADLYAHFRRTIKIYTNVSRFPEDILRHETDENAVMGTTQVERRDERDQYILQGWIIIDGLRPVFSQIYGVCSVIHSVISKVNSSSHYFIF